MKIKLCEYTKILKKQTVLDGVSFEFTDDKIYGLHGKNGSGKTMLLRAICGLILPTKGYAEADGQIIGSDIEFPESVGIIIENMTMLPEYSGIDNLKMLAKIKGIASEIDIRNAIEAVGLDPNDKKRVKAYSLGMKQKLNIAQAIMEKPKLLLLDEPTNALDDETVASVRALLLDMKKQGTLIIIASHNRDDLSTLCDEIIEIDKGKIVKEEEVL